MEFFDIRENVNGRSLFRFRGDKDKCQEYIDFNFGGELPSGWNMENMLTCAESQEISPIFTVTEKEGIFSIRHNLSGTVKVMSSPINSFKNFNINVILIKMNENANSNVEKTLEIFFPELIAKEVDDRFKAELPDDDNCPF